MSPPPALPRHRPAARRLCWAWALLAATLGGGAPAASGAELKDGQVCYLSRDVPIVVKNRRGSLNLTLDAGRRATVVQAGAFSSLVRAGEIQGLVDSDLFKAACRAKQVVTKRCRLNRPVKVDERTDGSGRAWRIKKGGTLTLISEGPAFSAVRIGPVEGFVKTASLRAACAATEARVDDPDKDRPIKRDPVALPRLRPGDRVAVVPFVLQGGALADDALEYEQALSRALLELRTDVASVETSQPPDSSRQTTLKRHLLELRKPALDAGIRFIVTGEVTLKAPAKKPAPDDEEVVVDDEPTDDLWEDDELVDAPPPRENVLLLAVFDVKKKRVLKTVRVEPTADNAPLWPPRAAEVLNTQLPSAGVR